MLGHALRAPRPLLASPSFEPLHTPFGWDPFALVARLLTGSYAGSIIGTPGSRRVSALVLDKSCGCHPLTFYCHTADY